MGFFASRTLVIIWSTFQNISWSKSRCNTWKCIVSLSLMHIFINIMYRKIEVTRLETKSKDLGLKPINKKIIYVDAIFIKWIIIYL